MALIDAYSPCPCGSGDKYKFCCQKVESYAERVQRLLDGNQPDQALKVLDEGLRHARENPLLAQIKAALLARRGELVAARDLMARVVAKHPKHAASQALYIQILTETDDANVAAGHLQQALAAIPPESRSDLISAIEFLARALTEESQYPAAIAHMLLERKLDAEAPPQADDPRLRLLEGNLSISPWLRNVYVLSPVPAGLDDDRRRRFAEALEWAEQGLWSPAAASFDLLSAAGTPESDRNLGLCRLWLGDQKGAVSALRRYTSWIGATPSTVDLEALCQLIDEPDERDQVEMLQWIWPLRNREALIAALTADPFVRAGERAAIDPSDPESPEVDTYLVLDRRMPEAAEVTSPGDVPRPRGEILVGQDIVAIQSTDDGRLDALGAWFRERAGSSIPPAHPRTKVLGRTTKESLAMSPGWVLPEGLAEAQIKELARLERRRMLKEVLPDTPMRALGGRTPRQVVGDRGSELALRATLQRLEHNPQLEDHKADLAELRAELRVPPEPQIDPATASISAIHLTRLGLVPAARLDDKRLIEYYMRARRFNMFAAVQQATKALLDRPHLLDRDTGVARLTIFSDLAVAAAARGGKAEAINWLDRGRQTEAPALRARNAAAWDTMEVRILAQIEEPEVWVPRLAMVLERYKSQKEAGATIMRMLLDLGLIQAVPSPDQTGEIFLDSRGLQAVLAKYGPRITTSSGELGVSAARSEIWTPGSETSQAGGGAVWRPGSTSAAAEPEEPKRLIIPGR